jgi:hypothetical protein
MIAGHRAELPDLSQDLTVFVTTVGDEANFSDCMAHLERQNARFRLEIIDHVAPLSAAFQEMLNRCATPYYIQVDEDMLLFPHAVRALYGLMAAAPEKTAMVCAPLWDCDVNHSLYGLKIYRHQVVRQFPYENVFSCERMQIRRLQEAGYDISFLPLGPRESCLGEHGKHYTPRTIFTRWRRLMRKRRRYGNHCARGVPGPRFLLERYLNMNEPLHFYALLGAISGLVGDLPPDRELDYREQNPDFERLTEHFAPGQMGAELSDEDGRL